jgi:hypothetical protein
MASRHGITGPAFITEGDVYSQTNYQMHSLGALGIAENGDMYRYTRIISTGTDLIAGYLYTSLGREANHQNCALAAAAAVGATSVEVTVGATAVDANEYDEGWLVFSDVSPEGELYKVIKHDTSTGSEAVTVWLDRPLKTAATTSSEVTLVRNPWNNPAVSQLIAERAAGVAVDDWDVSVANYGWLKTRGVAAVLCDGGGGTTVGYVVCISNSTNGNVGVYSDVDAEVPVGQLMQTGTSTEFNPVYLYID